jgi:hypothetical protein
VLAWPSFAQTDQRQISFALSGPSTLAAFRAQECALWSRIFDSAFSD